MNLPPLHKLGGPVCPPCPPTARTTPSAPTAVSVHELLLLAEARDRLKADQEAAEARYAQEVARYAQSVLTAFQEVDAAIAGFDAQRSRNSVVDEQLRAAEASAAAARLRVEQGVGDYVGYLDALRTLLNVKDTQSSAERELATARLQVHRALGGTWVSETPNAHDSEQRQR